MGIIVTREGKVTETVRAIVVGKANIGKTQLINRVVNGLFNEDYHATIGVDLKVKSQKSDNTETKLQLWDASGKESHQCIVASYYRDSKTQVYCVDLSTEIDRDHIEKAITDIKRYSNATKIMFVGTKADLCSEAQQAAVTSILHSLVPDAPILITSAKNNTGIAELTTELFRQARPFSDTYQAARLTLLDSLSNLEQDKKQKVCNQLNILESSLRDPQQLDKIEAINRFKMNTETILQEESIVLKCAVVLVKVLLVASAIILIAGIGFGIGLTAGFWAGPAALLTALFAGKAAAIGVAGAAATAGIAATFGLREVSIFKEPQTLSEAKEVAEAANNFFKIKTD